MLEGSHIWKNMVVVVVVVVVDDHLFSKRPGLNLLVNGNDHAKSIRKIPSCNCRYSALPEGIHEGFPFHLG